MTGIVLCAAYRVRLRVAYSRGVNSVVSLDAAQALCHDESQLMTQNSRPQFLILPWLMICLCLPLLLHVFLFFFAFSVAQSRDSALKHKKQNIIGHIVASLSLCQPNGDLLLCRGYKVLIAVLI